MSDEFTDDQVAAILSKEARDSSIKYSALGMSAFHPSKPPANKPKPNTRFLRNLVRETDSHNAALRAKEAADSRTRLERLVTKDTRAASDIRRRQLGSITAVLNGNTSKRQKLDSSTRQMRNGVVSSRAEEHHRDKGKHARKSTEGRDMEDAVSPSDNHRSYQSESNRLSRPEKCRVDGSRHRLRSRSPRERSKDPKHRNRSPRRRSLVSPASQRDNNLYGGESRRKLPPDVSSDSDPLEAIVGPLPPPKVKSRGRGTISSSSGIDVRFSDNYDPALDLVAADGENDCDGDDWELVLDRVKWQQQGAERLRAAGFTEEEVQGWKSGKKPEVKWAKRGDEREWDRGKSMNDCGE